MQSLNDIKTVSLDKLSYVAIPLKILSIEDIHLATCTGFIYEVDKGYYLITNWHNFTGKNPYTKKPLGGSFVLPAKVQIPFHKTREPIITWERTNFGIIDCDTNPQWLIHPTFKQEVDVVALKLDIPKDVLVHSINHQDFDNFKPLISDDVFILGFPYDLRGGGNFPIWKRATIASEPDIDINLKPQILVDTASRKGMSGSPVIFRRQGIHGLLNGIPDDNTMFGEIQNFIGIYSGHYEGNSQLEVQLGIVWKKNVIDEIIAGGMIDRIS